MLFVNNCMEQSPWETNRCYHVHKSLLCFLILNLVYIVPIFYYPSIYACEPGYLSHCSIWLQTGWPGFDFRWGPRLFLVASAFRPILGCTQHPVQWVLEVISTGLKCGQVVTLAAHLHSELRLRMSRSCAPCPHKHRHGMQRDSFFFCYTSIPRSLK